MPALLRFLTSSLELLLPPRKTEALVRATPQRAYEELVRPRTIEGFEALLPYSEASVSALIWELKYKDSKLAAAIAGKLVAEHLVGVLAEEMVSQAMLVPIPLHPNRKRERGYNQGERIMHEALKYLDNNVTPAPDALARTRDTPRQTTLKREARLRNIAGAFEANAPLVHGKTCILIDDVITTGTTLAEAKQVLLNAGASKVIAIALAYA